MHPSQKILLLFLLLTTKLFSQIAPVTVQTVIIPPYYASMFDYLNAATDKIIVNIRLNDISIKQAQLKIRLRIEGNSIEIKTNPNATTKLYSLDGGETIRLVNLDLAESFKAENLIFSGYSKEQYQKTSGRLPDGNYRIYFEVYEARSGVKVSTAEGTAMISILLNEPPLLLTPSNNQQIISTFPQNVNFQWIQRHLTTIGYKTEYHFQMVELPRNYKGELNAVFDNKSPFIDHITTQNNFTLNSSSPELQPETSYAFKIKASVTNDFGEEMLFKNNGYSEIFTFIYKENCEKITALKVITEEANHIKFNWKNNQNTRLVNLSYRKRNKTGNIFEWFTQEVEGEEFHLSKLNFETTYEYKIQASCDFSKSEYSPIDTFTTISAEKSASFCYNKTDSTLYNSPLIQYLENGQFIYAAGNKIHIKEVTVNDGRFSGKASSGIQFLSNVGAMMHFENISVNENMQLINGKIEAIYNEKDNGIINIDDIIEGGNNIEESNNAITETDISIDIPVEKIERLQYNEETNELTITTVSGEIVVVEAANMTFPITIQEPSGDIYQVEKNGEKTLVAQQADPEIIVNASITENKQDIACKVIFEPSNEQKYAFDQFNKIFENSLLIRNSYQKWDNEYLVYKAIAPGKIDYITARIETQDKSINPDEIIFRTASATILPKTKTDENTYKLTLVGGTASDAQEISAVYPRKDSARLLGKFILTSYRPKEFQLKLIYVNGNKLDINIVNKFLKQIYSPVLIDFSITTDECDYENKAVEIDGSGLLARYTDDMKNIYRSYFSNHDWDGNTYYMFICNTSTIADIKGVMPRGKQFGFIFTEANNHNQDEMSLTLAHELGHGLFALKHTYDNAYQIPKGATNGNLMDDPYAKGTLNKWQWTQLHDPGLVLGAFEKDEDGFANMSMEEYLRGVKRSIQDNSEFIATFANRITKYKEQQTVKISDYTFHNLMLNIGNTYNGKTTFKLKDVKPIYNEESRNWDKEKYIIYYENLEIITSSAKERDNLKEYFNANDYSAYKLTDIQWISQKNEFFKNETCYPSACCCVASNEILARAGAYTNRTQQVVINSTNRSDCRVLVSNENFETAVNIIKQSLKDHKLPIIVGVNHEYKEGYKCSGNTPKHTNHYIVIVDCDYDKNKKMEYFRFYEVGTDKPTKGISLNNRLYINDTDRSISGNTEMTPNKPFYYRVTEVRKNIGQKYK